MTRIPLQAAIKAARAFFEGVYADEKLLNLLLEEVQLSDDVREWRVTFGFALANEVPALWQGKVAPRRHYKVVRVDASTGEVKGMVLRENE
ncbi:MAG: hypothetical protein K8S98_04675 [Planctomycetes bacterium]|nr:hypothetical protein [Planctomycetota bacterium]